MRLMYIDEQFMYESDTLLEVDIHESVFLHSGLLLPTSFYMGYAFYIITR